MSAGDFTPWPEALAREYRERGWWRGETLDQMLRDGAERYGERIAIVCGHRRLSYAELDVRADRLSAGLAALGLQPGERVILQLPNIAEFFALIFACFRLSLVPVLALPGHRRAEIGAFVEIAEAAAYVIVDRHEGFDYRGLARELRASHAQLREVVVIGEAEEFTAFETLYQEPRARPSRDPGSVALLQLSGGSTGTPKLIPRTHDDYLYSVRQSIEICGFDADTVYLAVLPLGHNFPLSSPGTLGTLLGGGRIVLAPRPDPLTVFPLIAQEQVTHTAVVPALLLAWLAAAEQETQLPKLQLLQVGGASLAPDTARRAQALLGCRLQQVFGMAEGLVNYTRLDDDDERISETQGRPMSAGDAIRIVDDEDRELPLGETGNLLTRGPYTIRGYWRAPQHNARAFTAEGFYRTGDRVRLRADGYLQVMGRAKDQINRGGEKIAAEEVEQHLLSHPRVRNAALVSVPDAWLGERSCAFIELAEPADEPAIKLAMALKLHLRQRGLAAYKIPDRIEFLDRLPLTAPGKVSKQQLRERASAPATHRAETA